ncbi:acylphosphatase [soil metagenome]
MSDADTIRVRAVVTGRVQGVGFRWSARAEAARLGLSGFARNSPDGSVRVEAEGDADAVNALMDWLGHGPPGARVDHVTRESIPITGSQRFDVG